MRSRAALCPGTGSYGQVYLGMDEGGKLVAMKELVIPQCREVSAHSFVVDNQCF